MEDEFYFTNFVYKPDVYYFLYIGELKSYGLNPFLCDMFRRQLGREVEFIAIIPDVLIQYNYRNIIVIAPEMGAEDRQGREQISFRAEIGQFMRQVSAHPGIHRLIRQILSRQDHLYINMYESDPNMTLDDLDRVSIIGPDKQLARKFNNKVVQLELLKDEIPVIDFQTCDSLAALLGATDRLWETWSDGIFVSRQYSAAGSGSRIARCRKDIEERFSDEDAPFLISRYIPHKLDPTVLAVTANEQDVYIAGVADQVIEDGNRFVGSTYPSVLPTDLIRKLREYTRRVGRILARHGYRGIFGCDFLVDENRQIYFVEINARKQGTTLEFCYTLEQLLPEGSASLPELEYYAVEKGRFPENTREPNDIDLCPICWGTYNYKLKDHQFTRGYIPQNPYERESFCKVASGDLIKDFVVLEHIGSRVLVFPGTFLARIVSVGGKRADVEEGLRQGREIIELTVEKKAVEQQ